MRNESNFHKLRQIFSDYRKKFTTFMSSVKGRIIIALALLAGVVITLFVTKIWNLHAPLEFLGQAEEDWHLWAALTAFGTVGATVVALYLSFQAWHENRDATARVVSAWVTDTYEPRSDGSSYERTVKIHLANESNEPVFKATLNVIIGNGQVSLGPLSAPSPISVIPPRRELVFDISVPLLAHTDSWHPAVSLVFNDPKGRRWRRLSDGTLENVSRKKSRWSDDSSEMDERVRGDESLLNPMFITEAFLEHLEDGEATFESAEPLLAESAAAGWADVNWAQMRTDLMDYRPTSMIDYPAPRIARIKLSGDPTLEGRQVQGHGTGIQLSKVMFLTLVFEPERGWRIFGLGGAVHPDQINFGGGHCWTRFDHIPSVKAGYTQPRP